MHDMMHQIDDAERIECERLREVIDHSRRLRQRRTRLNSQKMAFERLADEQLSLANDWRKQAKLRDDVQTAATRVAASVPLSRTASIPPELAADINVV